MCVYSNVMDGFGPIIPIPVNPEPLAPVSPGWVPPLPPLPIPWQPAIPPDQLQQLLKDVREALDLARRLDTLLGHPDCERPEKVAFLQRIAALETELAALKKAQKKPRKKSVRTSKKRSR